MTTETLMTEAATTTEGQAASQAATTQTEGQGAPAGEQAATQQQTTEGQTTQTQEGQGGKTEGEQKGTEQKAGAPEQYEFKAPEGQQFDAAILGAFSEVAKELDLPQEAAQKVLDKVAPVIQARHTEQLQNLKATWIEAAKADKEFGGDKFEENLAFIAKTREAFADDDLRQLLDETGFGNHPAVIRFFYRAGKAISEDRIVTGAQGGANQQGDARRIYSNSNLNP